MMGLTKKGEYAIRGMIYLAGQPEGKISLLSEIAAATDAPATFLAKTFQAFVKNGLVRSFRGSGGGFTLGRPAANITLREIVETVEGPILPNRCLLDTGVCGRRGGCGVHGVWRKIQKQMVDTLDEVSLADLV